MEYDRSDSFPLDFDGNGILFVSKSKGKPTKGDSFPLNFEPNGIPLGLKSKRKLSPRSYFIKFARNWKSIFLSFLS